MGLVDTAVVPEERTFTGLLMSSLRETLGHSRARVKIVVLDCCFSGIATENLQSASDQAAYIAGLTSVHGAYTLTASDGNRPAKYGDDGLTPLTHFTRNLIEIVETGIPGEPSLLTLDGIFPHLRKRLLAQGLPEPTRMSVREGGAHAFAHNAAPVETHVDPNAENERLRALLAEAEAKERGLRVVLTEQSRKINRLRGQTRNTELTAEENRQLRKSLQDAETRHAETATALEKAQAEHRQASDTLGLPTSSPTYDHGSPTRPGTVSIAEQLQKLDAIDELIRMPLAPVSPAGGPETSAARREPPELAEFRQNRARRSSVGAHVLAASAHATLEQTRRGLTWLGSTLVILICGAVGAVADLVAWGSLGVIFGISLATGSILVIIKTHIDELNGAFFGVLFCYPAITLATGAIGPGAVSETESNLPSGVVAAVGAALLTWKRRRDHSKQEQSRLIIQNPDSQVTRYSSFRLTRDTPKAYNKVEKIIRRRDGESTKAPALLHRQSRRRSAPRWPTRLQSALFMLGLLMPRDSTLRRSTSASSRLDYERSGYRPLTGRRPQLPPQLDPRPPQLLRWGRTWPRSTSKWGLTWLGSTLVALMWGAVGATVDLTVWGSLGVAFGILFVSGSIYAIIRTSPAHLTAAFIGAFFTYPAATSIAGSIGVGAVFEMKSNLLTGVLATVSVGLIVFWRRLWG